MLADIIKARSFQSKKVGNSCSPAETGTREFSTSSMAHSSQFLQKPLPGCHRLSLPLYTRLLVRSTLLCFSQNSGLLYLLLEAFQGIFKRFILLDDNSWHSAPLLSEPGPPRNPTLRQQSRRIRAPGDLDHVFPRPQDSHGTEPSLLPKKLYLRLRTRRPILYDFCLRLMVLAGGIRSLLLIVLP